MRQRRHRCSTPLLLLLLLPLLLQQLALAFVVPHAPLNGAARASTGGSSRTSRVPSQRLTPRCAVQVSRVTTPKDAEAITDFFVANFWDSPIEKPKQRQQLMGEVYKDLTSRYMASPVNKAKRGGKSALLVAKEGGRVVGCVGLETRVIRDGQVTKLEAVKGDMPNASVQPVIANLAVDRTIRRKGVGAKILRECERVVKGWGFDELWLVVDEKNKPARTLYEKSGYKLMARDPRGMKVVPTQWQLREEKCTNLCMRKSVKAGAGGGGGGLGALFGGLFGGR